MYWIFDLILSTVIIEQLCKWLSNHLCALPFSFIRTGIWMLMLIYKLASFDWMGNIFELIPLLSKRSFITISSKRATNMVQHSSYVSQNSKKLNQLILNRFKQLILT